MRDMQYVAVAGNSRNDICNCRQIMCVLDPGRSVGRSLQPSRNASIFRRRVNWKLTFARNKYIKADHFDVLIDRVWVVSHFLLGHSRFLAG